MTFAHAQALVEQVSSAVSELRTTLENHELPGLETAILNSQMALKALEDHPGGVEGLRKLIATFSEECQERNQSLSSNTSANKAAVSPRSLLIK